MSKRSRLCMIALLGLGLFIAFSGVKESVELSAYIEGPGPMSIQFVAYGDLIEQHSHWATAYLDGPGPMTVNEA